MLIFETKLEVMISTRLAGTSVKLFGSAREGLTGFALGITVINLYRCWPDPTQGTLRRVHREQDGFSWSHFDMD